MVYEQLFNRFERCFSGLAWVAAVCLLAACGESESPSQPAKVCGPAADGSGYDLLIETPADYKRAVQSFEAPAEHCISPNLYVTSLQGGSKLYPEGFAYAWANSSTNAHRYLELNQKWGQSNDPSVMIKMITAIESYIGFPVAPPDGPYPQWGPYPGGSSLQVAVYTLPEAAPAQVPSFESWFKILETEFQVFIPLELGKLMIEPYTTMSPDQTVVDLFTELTGCQEGTGQPATCDPDVREALAAAGSCKVAPGCSLHTKECFQNFDEGYLAPHLAQGTPFEELRGPLRAILAYCQDANPYNTGLGLGFNTALNPFVPQPAPQSVSERYTGREFILNNLSLEGQDPSETVAAYEIVTFPPLDSTGGCRANGKPTDPQEGVPNYPKTTCNFEARDESVYDFLNDGYGFWD